MAEPTHSPKPALQPLLGETQSESLAQTTCSSGCASPEKKKDANTQKLHISWWLELSALALSLASLGALAALLSISDGQPVSKWAGLSLNAIVSILAGTSRASLAFVISTCLSQGKWNWAGRFVGPLIDFDRFDAASRGAWGSIRLLRTMMRQPHWASIGAFTVIILLAYEPFIQAVLTLQDLPLVLDSANYTQFSATELDSNQPPEAGPVIGRSSRLDAGYWNPNTTPPVGMLLFPGPDGKEMIFAPDFGLDAPEDMGLTASVWNGFSSFVTPRNLWPAFSCVDLSGDVEKTSGNLTLPQGYQRPGGWVLRKNETLPEVSNKDFFAHSRMGSKGPFAWTKHEIPEVGLDLTNYDGASKCGSGNDNCPDTYLSVTFTTNPGRTINFRNSSTLVLVIRYLEADNSWKENKTVWQDTPVTAQECGLYFCINEYETSLERGVLKERIVNSWTDMTANSYNSPGGNVSEYREYLNNTLDMHPYYTRLPDLQLFIPDQRDKRSVKETFNVTQTSIVLLFDTIRRGLEQKIAPGCANCTGGREGTGTFIYPSFGLNRPSGIVFGVGEGGNVSASVEKAALSLTKWMRDRELASSPARGEATVMTVITRVRWEFLIFPAVVHLLGLVFSIVSIWETHSLKQPAWKSSMLAALSHAPDGVLREKLREATTPDDIQEVGRKNKVIMKHQDGGDRLMSKGEAE
ncbi:hypothetical protein BHE90_009805 [Fusarium euwallaceae]|uniref:Uncharacterized protein n=1 Tax=Fusarium euwallaceae TaxID=1147111 RepID=A0A430LJ25_9HYPO|nr:hypothetical protein BHE90_009805 [Fusarium euwallaceae]